MKQDLSELVHQALVALVAQDCLPPGSGDTPVNIDRTRQKAHGDFATNIAMVLAGKAGMNPRALAEKILEALPFHAQVARAEIAGPGFINFYIAEGVSFSVLTEIGERGDDYGRVTLGNNELITVEFVSANPTGPLHVGHGRGAAFGDSLSRVMDFAGFDVHKEYYFNDAGRQMDILSLSVWLRYLEQLGASVVFPPNAYQGDYIGDIAASIAVKHGNDFNVLSDDFFKTGLGADEEAHLDQLIDNMRECLGAESARLVLSLALEVQISQIQQDLHEFRVDFDEWFTERSLVESGAVDKGIQQLKDNGHIYEREGALWFKATGFGDEKDRVVIRKNGRHTYFAADIAYMVNKIDRGFEKLIYIFGADHHGSQS